ncbi:uncharacterized protein LOC142228937 [Haematobia irritans]|uniref:uncharacterized protein LOC142228937 n=1 Tax=Haematobia irritans TaxID=7368 RepID=UPI003F507422
MHKNTLWLLFVLLCMYLTLVFCEGQQQQQQESSNDLENITIGDLLKSDTNDLQDEARTRRRHRHHLFHMWGWHALAIAYLVKIKLVIVAFFVGSAVYLGLRYIWPHKCQPEVILDHPPPSFSHHDHIPYASDHSEIVSSSWGSSGPSSSFEPYSAYSGSYGGGDIIPETTSHESHSYRKKREATLNHEEKSTKESEGRQMAPINEEQIGNFMFMFLGLDSKACRRRFICEMEFRSKYNPLTSMAFRVLSRSFFSKYTNDNNDMGKAHSYRECAAVNSECVFIENEEGNDQDPTEISQATESNQESSSIDEENVDLTTTEEANNSLLSNNLEERANSHNLEAERRRNSYWRHMRGDRKLKL